MQSGREWLLQTDKQIPRPELPAMGMAGQLQIKTSRCRRGSRARLVGQQNPGNSFRAAGQRGKEGRFVAQGQTNGRCNLLHPQLP